MQDSLHLDWASLPVPLASPQLLWVSLHDSSPPHILPPSLPASLPPSFLPPSVPPFVVLSLPPFSPSSLPPSLPSLTHWDLGGETGEAVIVTGHPTVPPLGSLQEGTQGCPLMGHIYEGRGGPARLSAQGGARPLPTAGSLPPQGSLGLPSLLPTPSPGSSVLLPLLPSLPPFPSQGLQLPFLFPDSPGS